MGEGVLLRDAERVLVAEMEGDEVRVGVRVGVLLLVWERVGESERDGVRVDVCERDAVRVGV